MKVTIYSTTVCPYCKELRDYLDERGVTYSEKFVDQDEQAREEMVGVSNGFMGVPFSIFEEEGSRAKVVGFDKKKIEGILSKIT